MQMEWMGLSVSPYAVMVMGGVLAALFLILWQAPRFDLDRDDCLYVFAWGMIGMAIGAKLLYLAVSWPQIRECLANTGDTSAMAEALLRGGFVFYGGLFGVLSGAWITCRYFSFSMKKMLPLFVPAVCVFAICGRIGCFLAGCCYGKNGIPVPLMEAAGTALILWGILAVIHRKRKEAEKGGVPVSGEEWEDIGVRILRIYLGTYALLRFFLEFLRGDAQRGFLGPLSVSQWISLVLLAGLLWKSVFCRKKKTELRG